MDILIYKITFLVVLSLLFGQIAKILTVDEKKIYDLKRYFPTLKIIFAFSSLVLYWINKNYSLFFLLILLMLISWDIELKPLKFRK